MNGATGESSWHVDPSVMQRYRSGAIGAAAAFSLEAHLVACGECRSLTRGAVASDRLERVLGDVFDAVDRPPSTPVERALVRLGVREDVARLLAATPGLTVPWLLSLVMVLAFAVTAAHTRPGVAAFLLLAPVLPLAGVAVAFGPGIDPAYEVGVAAPLRGGRLLLLRASSVLVVCTVLSAVAALALPGLDWSVVAWVLPSLATTGLAVALSTVVRPVAAAATVGAGWLMVAAGAGQVSGEPLAVFGPTGQVIATAILVVACWTAARRLERFEVARWSVA